MAPEWSLRLPPTLWEQTYGKHERSAAREKAAVSMQFRMATALMLTLSSICLIHLFQKKWPHTSSWSDSSPKVIKKNNKQWPLLWIDIRIKLKDVMLRLVSECFQPTRARWLFEEKPTMRTITWHAAEQGSSTAGAWSRCPLSKVSQAAFVVTERSYTLFNQGKCLRWLSRLHNYTISFAIQNTDTKASSL